GRYGQGSVSPDRAEAALQVVLHDDLGKTRLANIIAYLRRDVYRHDGGDAVIGIAIGTGCSQGTGRRGPGGVAAAVDRGVLEEIRSGSQRGGVRDGLSMTALVQQETTIERDGQGA